MGFISKLGQKVGEALFGTVIADYGTLPVSSQGSTVSITLRQRKTDPHQFVFKWEGGKQVSWNSLPATPETLDKLEAMLRDARERIIVPPA